MPLMIVRDNITHMRTDAIVNAANEALRAGGGVCGAIFAAAGARKMQAACDRIGHCDAGGAVITPGFRLPARYVIHTVGPVWRGGGHGERALLQSCYRASLQLARERKLSSVAFPLIASGVYGYPKDEALAVAVAEIGAFLTKNDMTVYLVVYDRAAYQISSKLFDSVRSYIDDHYVDERALASRRRADNTYPMSVMHMEALRRLPDEADELSAFELPALSEEIEPYEADALIGDIELELSESRAPSDESMYAEPPAAPPPVARTVFPGRSLDDILMRRTDTFSQAVLRCIDERGEKDADVYKRANLDRKLFSKLRIDRDYKPSKQTALALTIALQMNLDDATDLLGRAGYAFSPCSRLDLIVRYFIERGNYDIHELNEVLFMFEQPCLGCA